MVNIHKCTDCGEDIYFRKITKYDTWRGEEKSYWSKRDPNTKDIHDCRPNWDGGESESINAMEKEITRAETNYEHEGPWTDYPGSYY